jgi:hypothetical protein
MPGRAPSSRNSVLLGASPRPHTPMPATGKAARTVCSPGSAFEAELPRSAMVDRIRHAHHSGVAPNLATVPPCTEGPSRARFVLVIVIIKVACVGVAHLLAPPTRCRRPSQSNLAARSPPELALDTELTSPVFVISTPRLWLTTPGRLLRCPLHGAAFPIVCSFLEDSKCLVTMAPRDVRLQQATLLQAVDT